jgi:Predicted pyridoxal phosphate-dependent enzyme apparently involved in regulation of cell wall biogenesis
MFDNKTESQARDEILRMVKAYTKKYHKKGEYKPGDKISYAGRVYNEEEVENLVDSALDFWLTAGRYAEQFESEFTRLLDIRYCELVNSGSSANLLAFMALTSPRLGKRAIRRGDEVITVAAGFPTTVAPIIQFGAAPVFIDVSVGQYNADVSQLDAALSSKTKAVMLAHTMGNPFDIEAVLRFCKQHDLWLIEDNCDSLGSAYTLDSKERYTGTFGDIGTSSFYPPHHITMGEGGAVYTDNPELHKIILSFRDWGRDCMCPPGKDNYCNSRFSRQFGLLPFGYDHKYVYSHFGYNLKVTDMQAAVGCAQIRKLPDFIEKRRHNFSILLEELKPYEDRLILPEPNPNSRPSWFGFLITVRDGLSRNSLTAYLESKGIQTRTLFAGNLIKHPCFDELRKSGQGYRVISNLPSTERIMNDTFWVGVYPGMTEDMMLYIAENIKAGLLQ